jgi:hypothetical protein
MVELPIYTHASLIHIPGRRRSFSQAVRSHLFWIFTVLGHGRFTYRIWLPLLDEVACCRHQRRLRQLPVQLLAVGCHSLVLLLNSTSPDEQRGDLSVLMQEFKLYAQPDVENSKTCCSSGGCRGPPSLANVPTTSGKPEYNTGGWDEG